jgi:putative peptidoglycan lipid II flippase
MGFSKTITFSAGILAASSAFSYAFGLLRDRLLAGQFGASAELDVFNSSFIIPDFIMNSFAAALTTAFIPVFALWLYKKGEKQAWELTNLILYLIAGLILISAILVLIFAPWLCKLISPGFDDYRYSLLINTTRIMLLSPVFFSLSILFGSALQGLKKFISYAISPVLYNMGICGGIYFLAPKFGIYGAIYGVLIGAFCHMLIRFIELIYSGWQPIYIQKHWDGVREVIKLMIPRAVSLFLVNFNLWVYNAIASTLAIGSISIFNLTRNFQSMPVSLIGIAYGTALLPSLASHFAKNDTREFKKDLSKTIKYVLLLSIPATIILMIIAKPIVRIFLGTGKFDAEAVAATGLMLSIFALAIPFESLQHILARAFYARHDTITPVKITIIATIVNIIASYGFTKLIGVNGLALGFICYSITQVLLLYCTAGTHGPHFAFRAGFLSADRSAVK